jgi:hypothetical protein
MAKKTTDTKTEITYESGGGIHAVQASRKDSKVWLDTATMGPPEMTLDQLDKFADRLKRLVQDAREEP